nr:site-specific DNA-methyltransferase [Candidatus Sigynarchaeota archaeon]
MATPKPAFEIVIGDVVKELEQAKYKEFFDLMIADPPFGLKFDKSSHEYGATDYILYDDAYTEEEYENFTFKWLEACYKGLKTTGSLYLVSGWTRLREILNAAHGTKFHLINHVIWAFSWGVYARKRYVTSHYHVLFLTKHKSEFTFKPQFVNPQTKRKGNPYEYDVWFWPEYNRGNDPHRIKGHPCQLPLVLLEKIIKISSNEGDWIGDIFSGSGGTALAAKKLGRNVVSFEINTEYKEIIEKKASMWHKKDE